MLSDDHITHLEAQLHRAHELKAEHKAIVEHHLTEEKAVTEAEEQQRVEEAKACQIMEERVAAAVAARWQAILHVEAK